jgi:hypothetical protein
MEAMGHRSDELERAHQGCEALEDLAVELEQTDQPQLRNLMDNEVVVTFLELTRGVLLMATNEYRRYALECLCIADDNTTSPENRMLLVGMAQAWLKLAQRAEQNLSTETLWQAPSPPLAATAP